MNRILARLLALRPVRALVIRTMLWRERRASGVSYNPLSSRLHAVPYPIYDDLRTKDPVHRSAMMQGWVVSGHADVDAVLRDHRRFSSDQRRSPNYRRQRQLGQLDMLLEAAGSMTRRATGCAGPSRSRACWGWTRPTTRACGRW
jgi:cytochrome P450